MWSLTNKLSSLSSLKDQLTDQLKEITQEVIQSNQSVFQTDNEDEEEPKQNGVHKHTNGDPGTVDESEVVMELADAHKQIETLTHVNERQKAEVKRFKRELEALRGDLNEAELQNINITTEYRKLLEQKENELQHLKGQLRGTTTRDEDIPSRDSDVDTSITSAGNHSMLDELKLEDLQSKTVLLEKENEQLKTSLLAIPKLERTLESETNKLNELQKKNRQLQRELAEYKEKAEEEFKLSEKKEAEYIYKVAQQQRQIEETTFNREKYEREKKDTEQKLNEFLQKIFVIEQNEKKLIKENEELKETAAAFALHRETEAAAQREAADAAQRERQKILRELEHLRNELDTINTSDSEKSSKLRTLEQEKARVLEHVASLQEEVEDLLTSRDEAVAQRDALQKQLEQSTTALSPEKNSGESGSQKDILIESLETGREIAAAEISGLAQERDALLREKSEILKERETLELQLQEFKTQLQELQNHLQVEKSRSEEENGRQKEMLGSLQQLIEQLTQNVEIKQREIAQITREKESLLKQLEISKNQIEGTNSEQTQLLQNLESDFQNVQRNAAALQQEVETLIQSKQVLNNELEVSAKDRERLTIELDRIKHMLDDATLQKEKFAERVSSLEEIQRRSLESTSVLEELQAAKDFAVKERNEALIERDRAMEERNEVKERNEAITREIKERTDEKNAAIKELNEVIQEREALVEELQALQVQSQGHHTEKENLVLSLQQEVQRSRSVVQALQQQVGELSAAKELVEQARDEARVHQQKISEQMASLQSQLHAGDTEKDATMRTLRQTNEQLQSAVDALNRQVGELSASREDLLRQRSEHLEKLQQTQVQLQDLQAQIGRGDPEKDEALSATQQNIQRLQSFVESLQHQIENARRENEILAAEKEHLARERDDLKERENRSQVNLESSQSNGEEVASLKEKLEKSNKALGRLREHLMEMEEAHTLDAMNKEEQMEQLRNQLQQYSIKAEQGQFQEEERNNLIRKIEEKEEECARTTEALSNLQSVLEQFQADQEAQVSSEVLVLKKQLSNAREEADVAKQELLGLRVVASRCSRAEAEVRELQDEIASKTRAYIKLQEDVEPLRKTLDEAIKQLTKMSQNEQNLIDKRLIVQLLLTYFEGKTSKNEVLELIAKVLNLTDDEKKKIGLGQKRGWLPFMGGGTQSSPDKLDKNLSDMWVDFLLKEASAEKTT
eukprot:TRINITY_DN2117_c0_g2_i1.p1 TRINITY_DN2117_c0_g2~~TRINITY_DN2117_c0_g2_i1.p1  ORF type:complete len:1204 (+),score=447.48 TRINITY_DN2117_c0_g2_i1:123-3734(+)